MKFDIEKIKGKVIHCDTKDKAKQLYKFIKCNKLNKCTNLSQETLWDAYKEETCYRFLNDGSYTGYSRYEHYKNSEYTILEFEDILIQDKLRICEITGLEIGEKFNINGYVNNPFELHRFKEGMVVLVNSSTGWESSQLIIDIINNPELIEKLPKYTDEQKIIFKALKVLGFKYIARGKTDNKILAYKVKPFKRNYHWQEDILDTSICDIEDKFDFIKWEDVEPFYLVKALESIEKQ